MFVTVGALLLAVVAVWAVAYPIVASRRLSPHQSGQRGSDIATHQPNYGVTPVSLPGQASTTQEETLQELLAQRDAAFQALSELSFDHRVGKVTDEDYTVFEANLKQVAADRLRNLDGWEAQADRELGPDLERRVAAHLAVLKDKGWVCPECGRVASPEDRFCAACGATSPASASAQPGEPILTCPNCGKPFEIGDRFCGKCGQPLPKRKPAAARDPGTVPGR